MGLDAGFDMVPPLENNSMDNQRWLRFITAVKEAYKHDEQVRVEVNVVHFHAGEHPLLPFQGHKFRRFSSRISGPCSDVYDYLETVSYLARQYFGAQVVLWDESSGEDGFYDWGEVHNSIKSYDERLEKPVQIAPLRDALKQLPDVLQLQQRIEQIVDLQTAFVPARARPAIQKKLASRAWRDDWYQEDDDVPATKAQLEAELEELLEIQKTADACFNDEASECSWNSQVHYPLLRQATKWCSGVTNLPVTTARIAKEWAPVQVNGISATSSAETSVTKTKGQPSSAKMIDFALVLDESVNTDLGAAVRTALRQSTSVSVNHSDYGPLRYRPLGAPIETNVLAAANIGRTPMSVWAAGWFARMEAWAFETGVQAPSTLPVILVTELD
ncbi:uncharacterized protein PpBr36_11065 [Pyricularia pennisetigena]|uniref:uncharacterized protein n=1 Tax=Pyricularia pennisetigena TaxID=1578925 RepID=UPI001152D6E3|nr:uncharacterized protein PpBr36_11065 [Pyricularia pennisetigena]TLS20636.1 hypothetical protein PpBr36_11065 [Pyricularia pennisetigena]